MAPAVVTWVGSSGDWDNPSHWSTGSLPTPADDVQINTVGITVTHTGFNTDAVHSLTSKALLNISNGSLSLEDASSLTAGLTLSGGVLTGQGDLVLKGTSTWSGGTMGGIGTTTISLGASLNITLDSNKLLDSRNLTNLGQMTWSGLGDLYVQNDSDIVNGKGASFTVKNDRSIIFNGGVVPSFDNQGTFTKMTSANTTTLNIPFVNEGSLNVMTGTLAFSNGGNFLGGMVSGAGTYSFNSGLTGVVGSFNVTGTVNINNNSTVTFDSSAKIRVLNQSGGTLAGNGNVTIVGAGAQLNWTGGLMTGLGTTTVSAGAALNFNGTGNVSLTTRTLTNMGQATWSGANDIFLVDGALLQNGLGGVFTIKNDRSMFSSGTTPNFANAGTLTKTSSAGTTMLGLPLNNTGTLNVMTGTLSLGGAFNRLAGTVNSPATLDFGAGFTQIVGTFNVTGTATIGNFPTVSFDSSAKVHILNQTGGTLTGTGNLTITGVGAQLNWSGGTMNGTGTTTVGPGSTLNLNLTSNAVLSTRTLNNLGQATWSGTSDIYMGNSSVFINGIGATFNFQNDQTIFSGGGTTGLFLNLGTLTKMAGAGTTSLQVPLDNRGALTVSSGTLSLTTTDRLAGMVTGTGTLDFFTGTSHVVGAFNVTGTVNIDNFATVSFDVNASAHVLNLNGGTLTGPGNVTVTGQGSQLNWTGGTMNGNGTTTVAASATLNLNLSNNVSLASRTLLNLGQATWSGTNDIYLQEGAILGNGPGASFTIQNDQNIFNNGGVTPAIVNAGTFTKMAGAGATSIAVPFNNSGTLDVQSGMVTLSGGGKSTGKSMAEAGATLNIAGGVNVLGEVAGSGDVTFTGGLSTVRGLYHPSGNTSINNSVFVTFLGNGDSGPVNNAGTVTIAKSSLFKVTGNYTQTNGSTTNLNGGTLAFSGAGSMLDNQIGALFSGLGKIDGPVSNSGTLIVGGQGLTGILTVTGNYTQLATGFVYFDIGGTTVGSRFDQLAVTGTVFLSGTMGASFINGFNPAPGSATFKIMTYAMNIGVFTTENVPGGFSTQYNTNDLTII